MHGKTLNRIWNLCDFKTGQAVHHEQGLNLKVGRAGADHVHDTTLTGVQGVRRRRMMAGCFFDETSSHQKNTRNIKKGIFTRDRQPRLAAHKLRELWKE